MANRNILLTCFILFIATSLCMAGIRPSFELDRSTWYATDIVVASEGENIDGKFSVVEVLKGKLARGDILNINELSWFKDKSRRIVKPFRPTKDTQQIVVSGARMILFLKPDPTEVATWQSTARFGGMKVSVVWVEEENTYAFTQVINPGPSILSPQICSERKMQKRVREIIDIQESLAKVANIVTPVERAKKAAPFIKSNVCYAQKEAFRILSHCNASAVPILRKMLADESNVAQHWEIVDSMVAAGGSELGPELTQIVREELVFWKAETPLLKKGWWNGKGLGWSRVRQLRNRYMKTLHVFYGLRKLRFDGSRSSVQAFRDYWRSQDKLDEKNGLDQMSKACDDVLKALNRK
jgi:hypothetical protein